MSIGQDINDIESISIHSMRWNVNRPFIPSTENFKEFSYFVFTTSDTGLETFFNDYDDCVESLSADWNLTVEHSRINSLVELYFLDGQMLELFFDTKGNYFFQGKWYNMHDEFYYTLFQYFSDVLIPEDVLKKAEISFRGSFWYEDKE